MNRGAFLAFTGALLALFAAAPAAAAVWTAQAPGAPGAMSNGALHGVSCTSAESCAAVGFYEPESAPGTLAALAARWNGSSWSPQTVPQPSGSSRANAAGVSCPGASLCVLVGTYTEDVSKLQLPLAAVWNGSSWALQSVPVPEKTVAAQLRDVSCASATECVAVGSYSKKNIAQEAMPYVARWNGTKWTRQTAALPGGGNGGRLAGVSCVAATSVCTAAGSYYSVEIVEEEGEELELEVPEGTLVETWNGSKWVASSPGPGYFEEISCPSAEGCAAVTSGGDAWVSSAGEWGEVEGPAPGEGAWFSGVRAVSCAAVEECVASGEYLDSEYHLYLSAWDGTGWQLQTALEPESTGLGTLWDVSCVPAGDCVAVGESEYLPIAEHSQ